MNPCTLMGGFWFEAGRALFGVSIIAAITVVSMSLFWLVCRKR